MGRPHQDWACLWCSYSSQEMVVMFIFLEFPAPFLPLTFPGARLLMELPGMLDSEKLCLEYLWKSQPPTPTPGFCFKFQCLQDLGLPTYPDPTPEPRPDDVLSSRFLSPEQLVVSIETVTRNPPRGAGKTSVTMLGSLLTLLGGGAHVHTVLSHPVPTPLETGAEMRVLLNVVQDTV